MHPVERAALVHLGIGAIQPYGVGNKRVGRLIQNKILDEANLPPAIIPAAEIDFYRDLLCRAFSSYVSLDANGNARVIQNIREQGPFFNYISAKVNCSMDQLLKLLHDKDLCKECSFS